MKKPIQKMFAKGVFYIVPKGFRLIERSHKFKKKTKKTYSIEKLTT